MSRNRVALVVVSLVLVVAATVGITVAVIGDDDDAAPTQAVVVNPLADAAAKLRAEKAELVADGKFLPPTKENLIALVEYQGTGRPVAEPETLVVTPYTSMPDVPDTDLFGAPTGDDPTEWFKMQWCENGGVLVYDVNPYTVNAFQASLVISVGGGSAC